MEATMSAVGPLVTNRNEKTEVKPESPKESPTKTENSDEQFQEIHAPVSIPLEDWIEVSPAKNAAGTAEGPSNQVATPGDIEAAGG